MDVETGVLRVPFNEAASEASISQTRDSNVLVVFLSCALGPPTSLSILVRARLCCSLKGVVYTAVGNLQFLGNFLHRIDCRV